MFNTFVNIQATFPILEQLTLGQNDAMKGIWDEQLSIECFRKLKVLNLTSFLEKSTDLPINHFLLECSKLKTLVPSSVSFKNLTTLKVSRCHGSIALITCSTAKSLMLLKRMSITDCEMIEEIIACEGEEVKGGIVFSQLEYLQLSCLPSLASFSLGDHHFEFPVLEKVIVRECPKMKDFCQGDLSTPKLQRVQLTRDEDEDEGWRWDSNLKTTIQQLFIETVCITLKCFPIFFSS